MRLGTRGLGGVARWFGSLHVRWVAEPLCGLIVMGPFSTPEAFGVTSLPCIHSTTQRCGCSTCANRTTILTGIDSVKRFVTRLSAAAFRGRLPRRRYSLGSSHHLHHDERPRSTRRMGWASLGSAASTGADRVESARPLTRTRPDDHVGGSPTRFGRDP